MDENILVSVIMPVYNVEKYVSRCIDSILNQTYKHFELIIVDDGSTDNSYYICSQFNDSRIRLFHKENGGLSDARNFGTSKALGDYILYVDSDDYISTKCIQILISNIRKYDAEIIVGDKVLTKNDNADFTEEINNELLLSGYEACEALFGDRYFQMVSAWGKLIKKDIALSHPFPKGRIHEDEATTYKYFYVANKVVVLQDKLYAYYQNNYSSIMHTRNKKSEEDFLLADQSRAIFFDEHNEKKLAKDAWSKHVYNLMTYSVEKKTIKEILRKHSISYSKRLQCYLYCISKSLYFKVYRKVKTSKT